MLFSSNRNWNCPHGEPSMLWWTLDLFPQRLSHTVWSHQKYGGRLSRLINNGRRLHLQQLGFERTHCVWVEIFSWIFPIRENLHWESTMEMLHQQQIIFQAIMPIQNLQVFSPFIIRKQISSTTTIWKQDHAHWKALSKTQKHCVVLPSLNCLCWCRPESPKTTRYR